MLQTAYERERRVRAVRLIAFGSAVVATSCLLIAILIAFPSLYSGAQATIGAPVASLILVCGFVALAVGIASYERWDKRVQFFESDEYLQSLRSKIK